MSPAAPAERHRLVVLFSDLCASTALSGRLEPEELAELLTGVRQIWQRVAQAWGGVLVRCQGDGGLLIFGYPQPGEDDGRRAVEAALQVEQEVRQLDPRLSTHAGLHAGVTLVEPGDAALGLLNLVGEVPNQAAHLAACAAAGEVVVSVEALGPFQHAYAHQALQAGPRPLPAALRIRGRAEQADRFEAARRRGLSPLVGRALPRAQLEAFLYGDAVDEPCALLEGPGGMGKTRLLSEVLAAARPPLQLLRASFEAGAPPLQALRELLGSADADAEALLATLQQLAARAPLRLVLDDWQWVDDASRLLVQRLLEQPGSARVLLASRPTDQAPSAMRRGPLPIRLQPLDLAQTQTIVARWLPGLDPFSVARVHEHAGGLPLFIEELCHLLAATGGLAQLGDRTAPKHWGQGLVASRVARLPEAQARLLGAFAVAGLRPGLEQVGIALGQVPAKAELEALVDADFLRWDGDYAFKHGITRDAVYEGLALGQRRAAHARLAAALEADAPQRHDLLAEHWRGAGTWEPAARHAEQAGDAASALMALDRARAFYLQTLEALERQREASHGDMRQALARRWCQVGAKLGMVCLFDALALGDDRRLFERAVDLAESLGDAALAAQAHYWLAYQLYGAGRLRLGVARARDARRWAELAGAAKLAAQIDAQLGQLLAAAGDYDEALQRLDAAVQHKRAQGAQGRSGAAAVGSAYALACAASVHADRGNFRQAHAQLDEALALLGGVRHPIHNSVWNWQAVVLNWQGRWPDALAVAERSAQQAEGTGALLLLAVSSAAAGFARWAWNRSEAERDDGLQTLRRAQLWIEARGGRFYTSIYLGWLAQACAVSGLSAEARRHAARAFWRAREGERLGEAQAARALAWMARRDGDMRGFERWMARADASARRRGSQREDSLNAALRAERPHVAEPWFTASVQAG